MPACVCIHAGAPLDLAPRQRPDRAWLRALWLQAVGGTGVQGAVRCLLHTNLHRLPELFCGFQRQRRSGPTLYPVACAPQAWASAAPFAFIEASLGLEFDPQNSEIRLRSPRLPAFLDNVLLRNLQLGQSRIDLQIHRHADGVSLEVLKAHGEIQVSAVFSSQVGS
jgi:hypothetical protein